MPGSELYEGRAHQNDLGVTPSPKGHLYYIGPDLVIHAVDWTSVRGLMPSKTICGLVAGSEWKVAAGIPRRDICEGCNVG
jgi:hypothetical protein